MICSRCNTKTKKARPVAGYILCNQCHTLLINEGELVILNIKLTLPELKKEKVQVDDWFERCRKARLNAEMDGQPLNNIFW